MIAGDRVRVMVSVAVPPDEAFRVFTDELDAWWQRGPRFRIAGADRGFIRLEPGVGGRLFESFERRGTTTVIDTGRVVEWTPPARLVFTWRASNFGPDEVTTVEVDFAPTASGTQVTVTHHGFAALPADHPVRHGADVPTFVRRMGMWWGDLASSLRLHVARTRDTLAP